MLLEQILFFLAAIGALAGALGVVLLRNPFYSVLSLVVHLIALATLFLLLRAEFLAAAQVVVYAGAVMVLYVFVAAYIGGVEESLDERRTIAALGVVFAVALLAEVMVAVIGSGLSGLNSRGPAVGPGFGSPAEIGRLLLQDFLVPFEAASFLLLIAAVGAVVLGRRRRGLEELGADELPEPAGRAPVRQDNGSGATKPSIDDATRIPAGSAEGHDDPTPARSEPEREPAPAGAASGEADGR